MLKKNLKFLGGIMLIVGTSIGGGLLALPIATAKAGFIDSALFLLLCWLSMTISAFFILEVTLWLPHGSNMVSMAKETLGKGGQVVAWVTYLLLLYALLSAYVSGGSDVFQYLLSLINIKLTTQATTICYVLLFSIIVYTGIKAVDVVNSLLMYAKLTVYLLLLVLIMPKVNYSYLLTGELKYITSALMILITSYGFAIIVPSLRDYFDDDVETLKKVIFYGSLFPLACYIAWIGVIIGAVPHEGSGSLEALSNSAHATSGLSLTLEQAVHSNSITNLFRFFSSISMLTAFLGVSLCLFDFLSDGLKIKKRGLPGLSIAALVFIPPTVLVLYQPGIYIHALSYAGILCVILLLLLPALMAYQGRYHKQFKGPFVTPGGKLSFYWVVISGLFLLSLGIYEQFLS